MSTGKEVTLQEKIDHLRIMLLQLPKMIVEGNKIYTKAALTVTDDDVARGDGTEIGALDVCFDRVFGARRTGALSTFVERGEGLVSVVAILQDALDHKTGDKAIVRRWIDHIGRSAVAAYKSAEQKVMCGLSMVRHVEMTRHHDSRQGLSALLRRPFAHAERTQLLLRLQRQLLSERLIQAASRIPPRRSSPRPQEARRKILASSDSLPLNSSLTSYFSYGLRVADPAREEYTVRRQWLGGEQAIATRTSAIQSGDIDRFSG